MKAQRLLAITMLLLNRESVAAPELAKRFEVSARTIYRDIESLCEAGIPVVAYPGAGGGYGIAGGYKLDRSLVDPEEIGKICAALNSLSVAVGDTRMRLTADRLRALRARPQAPNGKVAGRPVLENYLFIELAPAAREREKIIALRRAIEERRVARFAYVDAEGRSSLRSAEPMALVLPGKPGISTPSAGVARPSDSSRSPGSPSWSSRPSASPPVPWTSNPGPGTKPGPNRPPSFQR